MSVKPGVGATNLNTEFMEDEWNAYIGALREAVQGTMYEDLVRDLALSGPHSGFIAHVPMLTPTEMKPIREAMAPLIEALRLGGQKASSLSLRNTLRFMEQGKAVTVRFPAE